MGVDSSALLTRWLLEPATRDFRLDDLVVASAMTSDEYPATRQLMEDHLLPLMAQHQVRYVQLARAGQSDTDGYEVLSDSRQTTHMIMEGTRWRLRYELFTAGTVPQVASGKRLCSFRAKGQILDWWAADEFGGTPYRHVIGFAADEMKRAVRDTSYTTAARDPDYPLISWGWDRQSCLTYLRDVFGVTWSRSCCGFCPFQAGREVELLYERWRQNPAAADRALRMEFLSVALNPRSTLFGRKRSARQVAIHAGLRDLVHAVDEDLATVPWAVYRVRRAYPARKLDRAKASVPANWDPYAKGQASRSLRTLTVGTCEQARTVVSALGGQPEGDHHLVRAWIHRAGPPYPSREEFLVAAPAGVPDKTGPAFSTVWARTDATAIEAAVSPWPLPLAGVN